MKWNVLRPVISESWLGSLALSHVLRLTLVRRAKGTFVRYIYKRHTTSWQKSLLSGSLQLKFQLLTTRILFLTLAWQLGENGQSPLMEQPSSQLTTVLVTATCLILICMVNICGKSWRVCWQKLDVLVGAVLWYVVPVKTKLPKGSNLFIVLFSWVIGRRKWFIWIWWWQCWSQQCYQQTLETSKNNWSFKER